MNAIVAPAAAADLVPGAAGQVLGLGPTWLRLGLSVLSAGVVYTAGLMTIDRLFSPRTGPLVAAALGVSCTLVRPSLPASNAVG